METNAQKYRTTQTPGPRAVCRTINVIREVDGIAAEVHVNIAYDPAPGVTFTAAREFEYALEMKIQQILEDMGNRPFARENIDHSSPRFIPINEAMQIANRPTKKSFFQWRWRHNARYPDAKIILLNEAVEINSLHRAVKAYSGEATA